MLIIVILIASFVCSSLIIFFLIKRADDFGLMAFPKDYSSHSCPTAQGGGVGIFAAFNIILLAFAINYNWQYGWVMFGLGSVIAITGLLDDIYTLNHYLRLAIHSITVALLIGATGQLPAFDIGFSLSGPVLAIIITLIGIWWVNLFNFMDGLDGLAALEAIFIIMAASAIAYYNNPSFVNEVEFYLVAGLLAAIAGFLLFNWPPARIFLGDVGSTYLGFIIFVFALLFIRNGWVSYQIWLILTAIFVVDASVTIINRLLNGNSSFTPHNKHGFQKLYNRSKSKKYVIKCMTAVNLLWLLPLAFINFYYQSNIIVLIAYAPIIIWTLVIKAGN